MVELINVRGIDQIIQTTDLMKAMDTELLN